MHIIKNQTSTSNNFIPQMMIISFIMLFTTGLIDSIIAYLLRIPFIPEVAIRLKDILLTLGACALCSALLIIFKKFQCNHAAFRITMCVLIDLTCYPYALEGNLTSMKLDKAIICVLIYCQLPQEIQVNLANINNMWLVFMLQGISTLYFSIRVILLVAKKYHDYLHYAIYYLIMLAEVSFVRIFTLLNDKKRIILESDKYKNV